MQIGEPSCTTAPWTAPSQSSSANTSSSSTAPINITIVIMVRDCLDAPFSGVWVHFEPPDGWDEPSPATSPIEIAIKRDKTDSTGRAVFHAKNVRVDRVEDVPIYLEMSTKGVVETRLKCVIPGVCFQQFYVEACRRIVFPVVVSTHWAPKHTFPWQNSAVRRAFYSERCKSLIGFLSDFRDYIFHLPQLPAVGSPPDVQDGETPLPLPEPDDPPSIDVKNLKLPTDSELQGKTHNELLELVIQCRECTPGLLPNWLWHSIIHFGGMYYYNAHGSYMRADALMVRLRRSEIQFEIPVDDDGKIYPEVVGSQPEMVDELLLDLLLCAWQTDTLDRRDSSNERLLTKGLFSEFQEPYKASLTQDERKRVGRLLRKRLVEDITAARLLEHSHETILGMLWTRQPDTDSPPQRESDYVFPVETWRLVADHTELILDSTQDLTPPNSFGTQIVQRLKTTADKKDTPFARRVKQNNLRWGEIFESWFSGQPQLGKPFANEGAVEVWRRDFLGNWREAAGRPRVVSSVCDQVAEQQFRMQGCKDSQGNAFFPHQKEQFAFGGLAGQVGQAVRIEAVDFRAPEEFRPSSMFAHPDFRLFSEPCAVFHTSWLKLEANTIVDVSNYFWPAPEHRKEFLFDPDDLTLIEPLIERGKETRGGRRYSFEQDKEGRSFVVCEELIGPPKRSVLVWSHVATVVARHGDLFFSVQTGPLGWGRAGRFPLTAGGVKRTLIHPGPRSNGLYFAVFKGEEARRLSVGYWLRRSILTRNCDEDGGGQTGGPGPGCAARL